MQPYPYNLGGGTVHITKLAKYLISDGHDVSIITSKPGNNQKPIATPKGLKIYNVGIKHKIFKNTGIFSAIPNLFYRLLWEMTWIYSAKRKLNQLNPDISNPQSSVTTALPCSLSKRVFVPSQHGVYISGFKALWKERGSRAALISSKAYEKMENFNAKRASLIICAGKGAQEYYSSKFGKNKCRLIYPGIDLEDFSKPNFSRKKEYLFMARLTEQKGLEYLISALELLDKQGVKLTLNVVGEGEKEYVQPIKQKALNLKNIKVNFLGNLVGEEKNKVYARTKVFISSSIFEPFGIAMVEAMASGCAVVSAEHDGSKVLVKSGFGKVVPFKGKNERALNLAKAIKDSLKWNISKMGQKAILESKKYSYESIAKETEKVFKEALNNA